MMPDNEELILVDEHDRQIGTMEKMQAHREAALHRAISVFVFHSNGNFLLQQRALTKYHSGGLWTNTCCSHPRPGESNKSAAIRRLQEEMGFTCDLEEVFSFVYFVALDHGLCENEYDHVFFGFSDQAPSPNPDAVESWAYKSMDDLLAEVSAGPEAFTKWFLICLPQVIGHLKKT